MYALAIQAEKDVLNGKTVTYQGTTRTLEDLSSIREAQQYWLGKMQAEPQQGKPVNSLYSLADLTRVD
jgi:hypothetical protein